jgi:hypothetical protein
MTHRPADLHEIGTSSRFSAAGVIRIHRSLILDGRVVTILNRAG